jgi:uncharacterized membrane protein
LLKHLDAKPRLLVAILVAATVYFILPQWMQRSTRMIVTWDLGVISFLTLVGVMMNNATTQKMQRSSQREDESRWTILALVVAAACASLLAIGFMLAESKNLSSRLLTLHITHYPDLGDDCGFLAPDSYYVCAALRTFVLSSQKRSHFPTRCFGFSD